MRQRPPRPGSIVADISALLGQCEYATLEKIHEAIIEARRKRGLPPVPKSSIRGALNSNTGSKGHGLFRRTERGRYALRGGNRQP